MNFKEKSLKYGKRQEIMKDHKSKQILEIKHIRKWTNWNFNLIHRKLKKRYRYIELNPISLT